MSSKSPSKTILTCATLAGGLMLAGSSFAMTDLGTGYMLSAGSGEKAAEGKCGEGRCGVDKMDADKDGQVSRAEFAAAHDGKDDKFAAIDADGDGFISAAEADAHHKAKAEGACGGHKDKAEGSCGGDKDKAEGKCGEGACGGAA